MILWQVFRGLTDSPRRPAWDCVNEGSLWRAQLSIRQRLLPAQPAHKNNLLSSPSPCDSRLSDAELPSEAVCLNLVPQMQTSTSGGHPQLPRDSSQLCSKAAFCLPSHSSLGSAKGELTAGARHSFCTM